MKPIAILGAGLAGLTAAADLKRRGLPVIVFEAGKSIGGMAASFRDADGYTYDYGGHFISNRLADALGAADLCRTVKHYGETVLTGGKIRKYPTGLLAEPRYVASALAARVSRRPVSNAAEFFRARFGEALAEEIAIPLAEAWSGAAASDLSPAVGQKFGAGIAKSLYLSAAARITGRAVCNGYSHERAENAGVYHVYPTGGLSTLLGPTAREVGKDLRLESPVERIVVDRERVAAVRVNGAEIPVSAVVSTAPVHVLPRIVEGTDKLEPLRAFRYRPMVFVNLRFSGRNILPDTMMWVPDRGQPFFRLTETPISMPWLAPEGKTLITCDIGCAVGDDIWTMSDADLAELCLKGLSRIMDVRGAFLGTAGVVRTPIAYPVYLNAYETERQRFRQTTSVPGLYSIGRNGEFAHILMEDVYWRTLSRMETVVEDLRHAEFGSRDRTGRAGGSRVGLDWLAGTPQPGVA